jgi:hypothetical protein
MMPDELTNAPVVAPRTGLLKRVAFALLGAALVWIVLTRTLPTSLAETAPETALLLQPNEPRILLKRARADVEALYASLAAAQSQASPTKGASAPAPVTPSAGDDKPAALSDRLVEMAQVAERLLPADTRPEEQKLQPPSSPAMAPGTPAVPSPSDRPLGERAAPPDKTDPIRDLARRSIGADPFNASALTILGQLSQLEGNETGTGPFMQAAARLSIRESYAVYWLLQQAQVAGDEATVIAKADTLLRTRARSVPLVVPVLAQLVEKNKATSNVAKLLATNPPWRPAFFSALPQSITDARTPLYLLLGLQGTDHPPSEREISSYLAFLMSRNFPELAYYAWLQFLPPEKFARLSPLHNGGFEAALTGVPFDWALSQGSGVTSEIRPLPGQESGQALFVEFTQGRAEFPGVTQTTLLGPGTYTLSGKLMGTLVGTRGLVWRVTCLGAGAIAQTEQLRGDIPQWRAFSQAFKIPADGCRAQQIRLELDARSASEQLVTGSLWFDDLAITRAGNSGANTKPTPEL